MILGHALDRPFLLSYPLSPNPNPSSTRTLSCFPQFPWHSSQSSTGKIYQNSILPPKFRRNRVKADAPKLSVRACRGGGFESLIPESELKRPSLLEFVTSERVKVVAMLGLALALCNADRVVMSVAIVPLSRAHGWTQSFSGIVQVLCFLGFEKVSNFACGSS